MKRRIVFLGVFILLVQSIFSEVLTPVKWTFKLEKAGSGVCNLIFKASIDPNWHLYSQNIPDGGPVPTSFHFNPGPAYELVGPVNELSKAEIRHDPSFNLDLKLFTNEAIFIQKIKVKNKRANAINGTIEFMSCDDHRCLPPREVDFSFTIPSGFFSGTDSLKVSKRTTSQSDTIKKTEHLSTAPVIEKDSLAHASSTFNSNIKSNNNNNGSLWGFILYAFLWGLAGVLTPCVYPMIPMTVSFFMRDEKIKARGVIKGIFFGVSIILIYTLIGLLVSFSILGSNFGNVLSSHWIPNLLFFLMFFVFALSFFGMFEIVLPASLVNSADKKAEQGGLISVFFMALTLIIVSFSCTGPIIGKILIEASQGIAARPIAGMFGYSLAFALPFTLFALFPSLLKKLPKSGGWLNSVKVTMAFILLALSLKFLLAIDTTHHFNILTRDVYLSIWIVLSVLLGFYFLGKIKFTFDSDVPHIGAPRLILATAVFAFAVYMVPGLFGAPLTAISSLIPPLTGTAFEMNNSHGSATPNSNICETPKYSDFLHQSSGLQGYFDLKQGMDCANKLNKPVFLDIKGHTCSNCKEMEASVFSDPRVSEKLQKDFVIISLYVDDALKLKENEWVHSTYDGKIKKTMGSVNLDYEISTFKTNTQPLYAILNLKGKPVTTPMEFNLDVNEFLKFLDEGVKNF